MENYKSNSYKNRQQPATSSEQKKVQKVISGTATVKKRTGFQKFIDSFIGDDMPKVRDFVIKDVIVPSVKKGIADIFKNGIDIILYGDVDRSRNSKLPGSKISYGSYYGSSNNRYDRPKTSISRLDYDYDEITLADRGDAELVLTQMDEMINKYGLVTIGDLYDLVGKDTTNHCVNNYGWTNLSDAGFYRVRDGYRLRLPRALPID